ncbi:TPA: helix-turn-helix transcriptional regulator [Acinetobacter baumannii]|jgi:transcriptional regulator with XRE-family HTH domain|nr:MULTISPECIES: helix-turn-helix transcriptional regulator [Acinetobacter]MBK5645700.1 helix-turn-helix transcriptional regulator [Acinetobacter sp.]KKZ31188.1 XRE family transcriptional regulator [Acinetobacter baumannii]KXZ64351.1 Transcriptional regulator ClgR [Acinetobacter venetianus]MBR7734305.1 helix-turn-helix transcriptional regulator [Acinetobacter nosocomialis]TPU91336.1 helix-turn-helix transcriptional regulator [Acinetobacter baumannii]
MIHNALVAIRKYHGISQSDLSIKLGISNSYLSEIEKGKKKPSLDILEKYSEQFDMPLSSLLFFSEKLDEGQPLSIATKFKLASAKKIIRLMEWLSDNEKA